MASSMPGSSTRYVGGQVKAKVRVKLRWNFEYILRNEPTPKVSCKCIVLV